MPETADWSSAALLVFLRPWDSGRVLSCLGKPNVRLPTLEPQQTLGGEGDWAADPNSVQVAVPRGSPTHNAFITQHRTPWACGALSNCGQTHISFCCPLRYRNGIFQDNFIKDGGKIKLDHRATLCLQSSDLGLTTKMRLGTATVSLGGASGKQSSGSKIQECIIWEPRAMWMLSPTPSDWSINQNTNSLIYNRKNSHHGVWTVNPLVSPCVSIGNINLRQKYNQKILQSLESSKKREPEKYNDSKSGTATYTHLQCGI